MGRRVLFSFAFVLGLFAVGFGIVYVLSEIKLRQFVRAPAFDQPIPEDAASLKRGEHIARTRGCFGCHGQQLEGAEFSEGFGWGHRAVAPNLAKYAKEHNIATLETAIRGGVGTDGRALWFMPSYNYKHLDNHDLAALIAFLRSATVVESDLAAPRLGFMTRWSLATGSEDHMAALVLTVPPLRLDSKAGSRLAQGEYIAMTTCNECHGFDLRGSHGWGSSTPDLAMIVGYSQDEFRILMQEGIGIGGRKDLGLMSIVAKDRFAHFSDDEITSLYAFLTSLADQPVPEDVLWRPQD